MSSIQASSETKTGSRPLDMKLEVTILPVKDVDHAKRFYDGLGWRLDADFLRADGTRAIQFTPPGSPASIQLDKGPAPILYLVVSDIEAARAELAGRGIDVSEVYHRGAAGNISGPDPERRSYASFATFKDPDGNGWLLQEVTNRLPGRVDGATFATAGELANALRRAATAHGEHEKQTGKRDENWADWYADHIVREQTGAS